MIEDAFFSEQTERRDSLGPTEEIEPSTKPRQWGLDDLCSLAWRCVKLVCSFLQRWLNLCEVGVEEVFFALTMLRPFAGVNFAPVTEPQQSAPFNSRHLLEEREFSQTDNSPATPEMPSNSAITWRYAISWRSPWLYLILLLLIWLLLF